MFALCILMALIVMPLSLLPGGMSLLGMWVRLMVWVQTWPLFFAVLNFMGHLWLAQSAQTVMISNGMGLNMLTQNGLAEAAWDKYCIVQYLYLLVPLIAWGVVSRSGHAIVSLAERLAPTIGRSLGGAAVDNTLSFDTQQFHNRSRGMFSFAQQQLSPSFQSGTVMDDGQMVARHKAIGVKQGDVSPTVQEHMTSLRTNVASNYESSGSLLQASEEARQTGLQAQKQSQETRGYHESTAKSLSEALSQGRAAVQGWSQQENTQKAQKISYSITAAQNVSDAETARDERGQSFGVGVNSSTPKLIGTSFHANAERRSNASDISTTEQTAKVDTSSGFSKEQSEVYQAIKENRMNYSDDETRRLAQDFRHSYDQTKQYQESTQAHFSRSARLQEAAHISEKLGSTINTNLNDSALQYTANKRFSGDKTAAAHWQHDHKNVENPVQGDGFHRRYSSCDFL